MYRMLNTSRRLERKMEALSLLCLLLSVLTCQARVVQEPQQDCMMEWLLSLGIGENLATSYHRTFSEELVDQVSLKLMCQDDLKALGVAALGHRVLIHCAATTGSHDVCKNGGSCNYDTAYRCNCSSGFNGCRCQYADNGCRDDPCRNGGTCTENDDNTICCVCSTGYRGDLCQHNSLSSNHSSLSKEVMDLSNEVEMLREASQSSALTLADTMIQSTGLRFFKKWLELDLVNIFFIRHFTIELRCFLGVITHNARQAHRGVVIYELVDSERLVHIQTLPGGSSTSFKSFPLQGYHYLVVGHHYDHSLSDPPRVNSELFRWNGTKFVSSAAPGAENDIRTMGIKDVDYVILPDNNSFLAFAAHDDKVSFNIPVYVYRHHSTKGQSFYHFPPNLPTTGALRVNFFTFNSTTYLFVAEERSSSGDYHTTSSIFCWNSTQFVLFQEIETDAANDLLPFSIGDNFFVVAVNNRRGRSRNIQSIVYILCDGVFVFFCALDTKGGRKVEFFRIGIESFLVFSNSQDDTNGSASTDSIIYRVEGGKFVPFQGIHTHNAMYVHVFALDNGCTVLAIANKAGTSALYKWSRLSYTDDHS